MLSRNFFGSLVVRTPHFPAEDGVQSLVGELRSRKLCHIAKKKRKKKEMQSIHTMEYHMHACSVLSDSL